MKIALNGTIMEQHEAVVSVYDHGFLYGMGLFETFRTYGGCPFLWEAHLRRLTEGCAALGIDYIPDSTALLQLIEELLRNNDLQEAYVRLSVSAGIEPLGLPSGSYASPNEIVYIKPLPPHDETIYEIGRTLQLLRAVRNSPEGPVRHKSFHYMNNILAKRELLTYPWSPGAEGIMLNARGNLTEGIVSNLFFIQKGRLCTPSIATGILPGITRDLVLELAQECGIWAEEGLYTWTELASADEVFTTNSISEIMPIHTCYDLSGKAEAIGAGKAGPLTKRLIELYRQKACKPDETICGGKDEML